MIATPWTYTEEAVGAGEDGGSETEQPAEPSEPVVLHKSVDLSQGPPSYQLTVDKDNTPNGTIQVGLHLISYLLSFFSVMDFGESLGNCSICIMCEQN